MAQRVTNNPSLAEGVATVRPGKVRGAVVAIYARAARNWQHAPSEIARGLRDARQLHSRERRFVSEAVHGLVRMRRRLAFSIDLPTDGDDAPDALYLAWLAAEGHAAVDAIADELQGLGVTADRLAGASERMAALADPIQRLAVEHSFPAWLVAHLVEQGGEAATSAFLAASNVRAPLHARANRLKIDRDALAARLAKDGIETRPIPDVPDGLELLTHQNVYGLDAFRDGLFELQDAASQLIAEIAAPPPRGRVLDLCAGAGGKTLHLAALLGGGGRITACDVGADKLEELRKRARRAGATNVEAKHIEREGALVLGGPFDRVLCDAPCTGSGVLRRNPESRWRLSPRDVEELPRVQLGILRRAAPEVRSGGRLVYATCSVLRAENEEVVAAFLDSNPEFEQVLLKEILGRERALAIGDGTILRTAPERQGMDGFFCAVLRRR